eukprot:CAMPEP_0197838966 /NCGR_PEP_ID=MMETSP1437-20131217/40292_1 /TAXON_ID=49252 ORGANISM="Eucampia antarctica, Strain CCMP1452" /NCGR_SAMPLE_ID=MMETSP1437 /ASSEMBLY_ACC=CAM_ASM_001096 /LENGTH=572 /DNA_ID=CAMNT_0043447553 /DNA_START=43 /DNA_END=1761 /DNA_ORIENTATION=-
MNVSVIGIGAMGGGIARALLKSSDINSVIGYDVSEELTRAFYEEAQTVSKECSIGEGDNGIPICVEDVILPNNKTNVLILVLVNEAQCQQVCSSILSTNNDDKSLGSMTIVLCSTVRATWVRETSSQFEERGIAFVDCPISGGPIRALAGKLSIMASCNDEHVLTSLRPLWKAMAGEDENIHMIPGGSGMGSTAKMVHQLLAGVHVVCSAEALTLAAKAGLDPEQMYKIVNGAAGHSWMFQDRGARMIQSPGEEVKSALNIFVKDLDIVHSESRAFQSPIPIASAALQQFISGQSLGLGKSDDSQVIQVYEKLANISVANTTAAKKQTKEKEVVVEEDIWTFPDGTKEEIIEVGDEPRHNVILSNEYTRVMKVQFPPGDTTCAHRHSEDSLYFFLVTGGLDVIHHAKGSDPNCDCMEFGEVRYGTHKTDKPLVHKIKNTHPTKDMNVVDAELIKRPPVTSPFPMVAERHTLIKSRDKCRVYHLVLPPGESVTVHYPFFYLSVVLQGSTIHKEIPLSSGEQSQSNNTGSHKIKTLTFMETFELGQVEWNNPTFGIILTNKGVATFEQYIAEWC